jgi:hypothetical protein
MQTQTTIKRFDLGQLKAAALAVGLAASVAVGAVTYSATRHDDAAVLASSSAAQTRFFEAKLARLEAVELHTSALAARAAQQDKLQQLAAHKWLPTTSPAAGQQDTDRADYLAWQGSQSAIAMDAAQIVGAKYDYLLRDLYGQPGDDMPAQSPSTVPTDRGPIGR